MGYLANALKEKQIENALLLLLTASQQINKGFIQIIITEQGMKLTAVQGINHAQGNKTETDKKKEIRCKMEDAIAAVS